MADGWMDGRIMWKQYSPPQTKFAGGGGGGRGIMIRQAILSRGGRLLPNLVPMHEQKRNYKEVYFFQSCAALPNQKPMGHNAHMS